MAISMMPPSMEAFPASLVPNFLPMISPPTQMAKVTAAMIRAQTRAVRKPYSAIVNPTESASIEVATPWTSSAYRPTLGFSTSPPFS